MAIISRLLTLPGLHILPAPAQTVGRLIHLLQRHPTTGGGIFDLQIIATMQANNIGRIYTFDADFQMFSELTVVAPTNQTTE